MISGSIPDAAPLMRHSLPLYPALRYWRNIEFFIPFKLDELFERSDGLIEVFAGRPLKMPWEDLSGAGLNPEYEHGFDIYLSPFALAEVSSALSSVVSGLDSERTPDYRQCDGLSCVLRLSVTPNGEVITEDVSISTLPWAVARYSRGSPLSLGDFDAYASSIMATLHVSHGETREEENPRVLVDYGTLHSLATSLAEGHPMDFFPNDLFAVVVPYRLGKKKPVEEIGPDETVQQTSKPSLSEWATQIRKQRKVDILNSFFLRDIERVHDHLSGLDARERSALTSYLGNESAERIDTSSQSGRACIDRANTERESSAGRWPRSSEIFLSKHQAFALQEYLHSERALFAVNGPPGTGKTTMVRDLLAHLVVERAKVLAGFKKPADALTPFWRRAPIGRRDVRYRQLDPRLAGFELLVASNNNAAVENISLELPRVSACAAEFGSLSYLGPIAALYHLLREHGSISTDCANDETHGEFWGLPSIALGNAGKRRMFRRAFYAYPFEEQSAESKARVDKGVALTISEWRAKAPVGAKSFHQAKGYFREKLRAASKAMGECPQAKIEYSPELRMEWHADVRTDARIERLRSELFVAALGLHEAWIREVPKLESELSAISYLLKNPSNVTVDDAKNLWQLLFMIAPAISTTLASVERMFGVLPSKTFGHVVIDEAGQATPQSALGLLMRCKKALIVGDQRQLDPVVAIPDSLERKLVGDLHPDLRSARTHQRECRPRFSSIVGRKQGLFDKAISSP